ncbi:MAG: carbohydrate binding domain-containing protein [Bacteroidales bacterium]|nr:carbohydrate binding domain-containing protein [Bacteroidales bacterium]
MKKKVFICLLLTISIFSTLKAQKLISINGNEVLNTVSPMIQGHGLIYSHEADSIYADGSMAQLYKDIGTSFLRWPGGTVVTHYHWNNLNGNGWSDSWDPNYDETNNADEANYMDLDEYIALCNSTEVEPMLGINMSSGMEWNRQDDALNEAVSLIKYCQDQNFDVQYFYLDNETYHGGNLYNKDPDGDNEAWTAATYAQQINLYADSIRKYIPNAKLIANWANKIRNNNSLLTLINNAGDNIDYIDIHWYWRWNEASWDLWKSQTPIQFENQWYNGSTFVDEISYFNSLTAGLNKPHIKIASLEWNIAPGPWQTDASHTKFKTALMQAEIQMQLMQGGMEIASMWSTQWPGTNDVSDRFLVDPDEGYTPNPTAKFFELYKNAVNGEVLQSTSEDNQIMSLVVTKEDKLIVYLLSKKDISQNVEFQIDGHIIESINRSVRFSDPGVIQDISLWLDNGTYKATVHPNSLTMIEFKLEPENFVKNGGFEDNLSHWDTWRSVETCNLEAYCESQSLQLNGNSSANQWIPVEPLTTYTLSAYAKLDNPSERVVLGVYDHAALNIYDTEYTLHQITFTTAADEDSVKIFYWRPPNGVDASYLDEVKLNETELTPNYALKTTTHFEEDHKIDDKLNFEIFPNPVNDVLKISGLEMGLVNITLYNYSGKCIYSKSLQVNDHSISLPVHQLPGGNYALRVINEFGNTSTKQIFIQ